MSEYMVYVWLALTVIFILIEVATPQLTTIWLSAGALISMLLAIFGVDNVLIQIVVFVFSSALLLFATRPLVKKYMKRKSEPTNADRNIGQVGVVIQDIDNVNAKGEVKIKGSVWTARSYDGEPIESGTFVIAEKIDGVKLIVKRK